MAARRLSVPTVLPTPIPAEAPTLSLLDSGKELGAAVLEFCEAVTVAAGLVEAKVLKDVEVRAGAERLEGSNVADMVFDADQVFAAR